MIIVNLKLRSPSSNGSYNLLLQTISSRSDFESNPINIKFANKKLTIFFHEICERLLTGKPYKNVI